LAKLVRSNENHSTQVESDAKPLEIDMDHWKNDMEKEAIISRTERALQMLQVWDAAWKYLESNGKLP
jgi:hypothetical protein